MFLSDILLQVPGYIFFSVSSSCSYHHHHHHHHHHHDHRLYLLATPHLNMLFLLFAFPLFLNFPCLPSENSILGSLVLHCCCGSCWVFPSVLILSLSWVFATYVMHGFQRWHRCFVGRNWHALPRLAPAPARVVCWEWPFGGVHFHCCWGCPIRSPSATPISVVFLLKLYYLVCPWSAQNSSSIMGPRVNWSGAHDFGPSSRPRLWAPN